jgi:hypothetical protein
MDALTIIVFMAAVAAIAFVAGRKSSGSGGSFSRDRGYDREK